MIRYEVSSLPADITYWDFNEFLIGDFFYLSFSRCAVQPLGSTFSELHGVTRGVHKVIIHFQKSQ